MSWQEFLLDKKAILEIFLTIAGLIVTVLLGVMAIGLTRAANRISESQLRLAERQAAVAEIELQPRFRFKLERTEDEHGPHDVLKIYNEGAPIDSFEVRHFEFVEIDRGDSTSEDRRLIPTYYFGDHESTGSADGLLFTMTSLWSESYRPPENATRVFAELVEALHAPTAYQGARMRMFVALYYTDASGSRHEVFYEVNPDWELHRPPMPRRLSSEMGETVGTLFWWTMPGQLVGLSFDDIAHNWEVYPKAERLWEFVAGADDHGTGSTEELVDRFGGFRDP